jgi:hypothetical protein
MTLERRIADLERTLAPTLAQRETVEQKRIRYRSYLDEAFGNDGAEVYEQPAAVAKEREG